MFPEDLTTLSADELAELLTKALTRYNELATIADADITDEQLDELEVLASGIEQVNVQVEVLAAPAEDRAARIAAARARVEAVAPAEDEPTAEEIAEAEAAAAAATEDQTEVEKEAIAASAARVSAPKPSVIRRAAALAKRPDSPLRIEDDERLYSLIASADVPGFSTGQAIDDFDKAVTAFQARIKGFRQPSGRAKVQQSYGVFQIVKKDQAGLVLDQRMSDEEVSKVFAFAADQKRLENGSLIAAGGWCAPSEILYDLPILETVDGLVSLPEVTVKRGGFQHTTGPNFGTDIYGNANFGFTYTEAQVIANTVKPFIDVQCPPFTEARLQVIGFGIRAGILTNNAWPELVKRYMSGALVAHAHRTNSFVLASLASKMGTAIVAPTTGSAINDSLAAVEMQVERLRYKWRLNHTATVEGVAPFWLLPVFRKDLAARNGVDYMNVTDAQIISWFAARGVAFQFVYDWQDLAPTGTVWPTTANVMIYPAGTFVRGGGDVIDFNALYDYDGVKTNTYTAMFVEESILVEQMQAEGRLITLPTAPDELLGRTGPQTISNLATNTATA